jgi:MFS family permease
MLYLTTPLWVVELVPPKGRSITAGIIGLFGVVGYILAAYVGVGFHYLSGPSAAQWRSPLALGCAPPLIGLLTMPWLPESPRWLLAKGRVDEAYRIVSRFHRRPHCEHDEAADAEFAQMREQSEREQSMDSSWWCMATHAPYRRRAVLVILLPIMAYSTGNLVITSEFNPSFFRLVLDYMHMFANLRLTSAVLYSLCCFNIRRPGLRCHSILALSSRSLSRCYCGQPYIPYLCRPCRAECDHGSGCGGLLHCARNRDCTSCRLGGRSSRPSRWCRCLPLPLLVRLQPFP